MAKILVIGGTGMLGRPVTVHLARDDDFEVRLFTTNMDRATEFFGANVEYAEGNVDDPQSLKHAMDGCDFVYINLKGGPSDEQYWKVEVEGSKNVFAAAKEAGIKKLVTISEARADEKHAHFIMPRVKVEAAKALKESGLTYVILKPTWFCESLPLFLRQNKAIYLGGGQTQFHFLACAEYAHIVAECFKSDKPDNKELTIFGPEKMPIPEAMRRFLAIVHPEATIDHLPMWIAKITSLFSFNAQLRVAVKMMDFFNRYDDSSCVVGPEEADEIFGRCRVTVEQWAGIYRKMLKGM